MRQKHKRYVRRYLPFVVSVILIIVLVSYAPWSQVSHILADFDLGTILLLVGLSLIYYGLKTIRFWYLLQAMNIQKPFKLVALSYMSAQPVSLLPGGEIYRSHALRRYTGVPIETSLPQFTMQGILEGGAMTSLMVISALALGTLRLVAISLAVFVLVVTIAISRGYISNVTRIANRLPFVNLTERSIQKFSKRHEAVLTWNWLPFLFGISLLIELSGTAIAYAAVVGLDGHINFYQAVLFYAIPIIVGFISLLPGGIGLSEQSAIGVLLLSRISIAHAIASTLIMRVTIVGLGVLYGCMALLFRPVRGLLCNLDSKASPNS